MGITLFEDFMEAPEKFLVNTGGGNLTRIDGAGGLGKLTTGSSSGNWTQIETKSGNVEPRLRPIFNAYLKTEETSFLETFIGLADGTGDAGSAANLIGFYRVDTSSVIGPWQRRFRVNSGSYSDVSLGVPGSTNFIEMMAQVSMTEIVWSLNGRLVAVDTSGFPTSGFTNNNMTRLVFWIKTTTSQARNLVVDYAQLSADR